MDTEPNNARSAATSTTVFESRYTSDSEDFEKEGLPRQTSAEPPSPHAFPQPQSLLAETAFIATLCMAQFMTQAAFGQVLSNLHIIGSSFSITNPAQLSWMPAAYALTVGTFILVAGRLGDLFGHKKMFVYGFLWFALWSFLAGFSVYSRGSLIFFDICRAFQGIGPAFLLPNALAILGRTYPGGRRKEMVFSIFGATAPGGFVFGSTFASVFAQLRWWPWAFWVCGVVCLLLAVAGSFTIPSTPAPRIEEDGTSILKRIDTLGALTGTTGLILVNFAWNQSAIVGWSTPYIYILLIIGVAILCVFAFVEKHAAFPLIPSEALTLDTAFVLGCIAAGWSSFGVWTYYSWQFLEVLRHQSPLLTCAQFSPVALSGLIAAITTGHILHKVPPSVVMLISMLAFTAGGILNATAPVSQTYWANTFVSVIIMPWGMDMSFPAATILLSDRMEGEHQGVAASLVNTVVNYSISIGLGIAGTVEGRVDKGGKEVLRGYRGAEWSGVGLSGMGIGLAVAFCAVHWVQATRRRG